ncbi:hypothetical protein FVE85_6159 [Porphyridium purpureum]|uniref:Uncharacterized protein n=1 Tax=Porphyridium purpureum TaxID=35688 RepID=A0A5J4Z6F4_PORPP|nr:hypothetical protein FVE85_6159 [Porphyridium purpureum]|eukprot:POR7208..scf295_1
MGTTAATADPEKLMAFAGRVSGSAVGAMNCALTLVGDQLGLYKALASSGPVNSVALAAKTNLSERWVREWLYHQACNGQIEYVEADDTFLLTPEAEIVLTNENHAAYMGGLLQTVMALLETVKDLPESFRTGLGQTYDQKGEACMCGIEKLTRNLEANHLVPDLLPQVDRVTERLAAGAAVADVGCGAATSTIAMAKAFPQSKFAAYDICKYALHRARINVDRSGVSNIELYNPIDHPLPQDGSLDLVTTFDVVHDTTDPKGLIDAIFRSLKPDGIWLCADIQGKQTFALNMKENPIAPLAYGFSLLVCMSSGLSVPEGAGLGTLGFHEQKAREMSERAGFTKFRNIPFQCDVMNVFYEIGK